MIYEINNSGCIIDQHTFSNATKNYFKVSIELDSG